MIEGFARGVVLDSLNVVGYVPGVPADVGSASFGHAEASIEHIVEYVAQGLFSAPRVSILRECAGVSGLPGQGENFQVAVHNGRVFLANRDYVHEWLVFEVLEDSLVFCGKAVMQPAEFVSFD